MTDIVRRAVYSITVDGTPVTDRFDPHLISLKINLTDGGKSDSLEIELDDAEGQIQLPREGADIAATIRWADDGGAVSFQGKTDEPESSGSRGGGMTLSITAHSADLKGDPKAKKQKHKDDATFGDVAKQWGHSAGLEVKIEGALAGVRRSYWAMANESYLAWGARMAKELGATFKAMGKKAVFVPRNSGQSASGAALPAVTAEYGKNLISWRISPVQNRARYRKSIVRWYDQKEAKWKTKTVEIGDSGAKVDLIETHKAADESRAGDRAKSNAEESKRGKGGGSVTIDGDSAAQPQAPCNVKGVRKGIDGEYRITSASHVLNRGGGWTAECQVEQPQGEAGTDSRMVTR